MSHTESLVRAVRALLFALVCVSLAGSGHALSSAHAVSPAVLFAAFWSIVGAAWFAGGRARGPVAICAGMLGAQLLLHAAFSWSHVLPEPSLSSHAYPGAHMGRAGMPDTGTHSAWDTPATGDTSSMTAAHLLAALGCAWWLSHGERALAQLALAASAELVRTFCTPLPVPLVVVRPRSLLVQRSAPAAGHLVLGHVVTRRGPPAGPRRPADACDRVPEAGIAPTPPRLALP
ncbi:MULTISPECIES: hypothetical protein [unclassified Streptomyces]|uniref:hypothetical protein n=1 Tax=unclassified Streptomyces TaxID=2593676 RepID=UPI0016464142|nr:MULTISPECIES: hypothetical protein [unclassified Streptomyces]